MLTLLAPSGAIVAGNTITLDDEQAHHARVRRVATGDAVRLVDGAGAVGQGSIDTARRMTVSVGPVEYLPEPTPMVLAVGIGDRDRFGWLIEKATELGVTRVIPLMAERSSGVATRVREGHLQRLRARARECLTQCGRPWSLELDQPMTIKAFIEAGLKGDRWLCRHGAPPPGPRSGSGTIVAVGPEGGFTGDEEAALTGQGFEPVALGSHVLRFETAAVAAAVAFGRL